MFVRKKKYLQSQKLIDELQRSYNLLEKVQSATLEQCCVVTKKLQKAQEQLNEKVDKKQEINEKNHKIFMEYVQVFNENIKLLNEFVKKQIGSKS
jgi:hypothetical protein